GDFDSVLPFLERALEERPNDPKILNYYGYFLLTRPSSGGQEMEKASRAIEKAVFSSPANPYYLDSYGWSFVRRGEESKDAGLLEMSKGVRLLELARSLSPQNAVISEHLASAYWSVGRCREAMFEWQKSLRLFDSDPGKYKGELSRAYIMERIKDGHGAEVAGAEDQSCD
ncbi:MAG: hypothetical protein LBH41_00400, partial [Rickettsiales bacterium]|nr:hypothetical protein [Rickettsiales bacterium]